MEVVLPPPHSDIYHVFGGRSLAGDQEVSETSNAKTPLIGRIKIGDTYAVLNKSVTQTEVV